MTGGVNEMPEKRIRISFIHLTFYFIFLFLCVSIFDAMQKVAVKWQNASPLTPGLSVGDGVAESGYENCSRTYAFFFFFLASF